MLVLHFNVLEVQTDIMKIFITLFALTTISISSLIAKTAPAIEVNIEGQSIFTSADYNAANETLDFTTEETISVIQIFKTDGTMVFQLPVMSEQVSINRNLFEQGGDYVLGFVINGQTETTMTPVTIR